MGLEGKGLHLVMGLEGKGLHQVRGLELHLGNNVHTCMYIHITAANKQKKMRSFMVFLFTLSFE